MSNSIVGISESTQTAASSTLTKDTILGKDDFLSLLTTQLKYQDPLNPQSNSEFAAQLATYSSLETLQNINDNMQTQILISQSMNNSYMISMIGKSVKSYGNGFSHTQGDTSSIYFDLPRDATSLKVKVFNSAGEQVATLESSNIKAGERAVKWDGKTSDGSLASSGNYTFSIEAEDSVGSITPEPISNGLVTGITYTEGIPYLLVNGQQVALSDVLSVDLYQQNNSSGNNTSSSGTTTTQSTVNEIGNNVNAELNRFISRVLGE
jgi:flagellar basal-body rod modification protein FlgD